MGLRAARKCSASRRLESFNALGTTSIPLHSILSSPITSQMQSRHNVWRSICKAGNAYDPVLALRAAFGSFARCPKEDDHIRSRQDPAPCAPLETIRDDPNRRGKKDMKQQSMVRRVRIKTSANDHATGKQASRIARHEAVKNVCRVTRHYVNVEGRVPFTSHHAWKEHMARIREESIRTRHTQLEDENPDHLQKMGFLNYRPLVVQPEPSDMPTPLPIPWATAMHDFGRKSFSANDCLSNEIERFAKWIIPTSSEQRARTAVVEETLKIIREALDPAMTGAELFGSEKSGIALPFSDIDICIYDIRDLDTPHFRLLPRLERVARFMRASGKFMLATIRNSAHPILNCHHRESGVDIQIVANDGSKAQQEVVTKYLSQVPRLREVYFVVRTVLSMRGLVDVFNGGMGSYGTFVMVLAILKRHTDFKNATSGSENDLSSASQLIAFLEFYRELDTYRHGIAVQPRMLFKKHQSTTHDLTSLSAMAMKRGDVIRAGQWQLGVRRPFQPYLLCLQDPANPYNDLSRRCHAILHIHATLSYLHQSLAVGCNALQTAKSSPASQMETLLLPLLGRCHEVYHDRRKRLEKYGLKLEVEGTGDEAISANIP